MKKIVELQIRYNSIAVEYLDNDGETKHEWVDMNPEEMAVFRDYAKSNCRFEFNWITMKLDDNWTKRSLEYKLVDQAPDYRIYDGFLEVFEKFAESDKRFAFLFDTENLKYLGPAPRDADGNPILTARE